MLALKRTFGRLRKRRLYPLFQAAAESLTGRAVQVNFCPPVFKGYHGQAYRTRRGFAIDIDPILDAPNFYKTFLHEVGHLHYGHCDGQAPFEDLVPAGLAELVKRRALEMPQLFKDVYEVDQDRHEAQARSFASELHHYAQNEALQVYGRADLKTCLRVLANTQILNGG